MPTNDPDIIDAVQELLAYVLGEGKEAWETNPRGVLEEHEIPADAAALIPALETVANQASFDRTYQQGVGNTSGGGGGGGGGGGTPPAPPHPDPAKPPTEIVHEFKQYFETNNIQITHDESNNFYAEEGATVDIIDNQDGTVINKSDVDGPVNNVHGDGNIAGDEILKDVTIGDNSTANVGDVEDQDTTATVHGGPPGGGYGDGVGPIQVTGGKDNEAHQRVEDGDDEEPDHQKPPTGKPEPVIRFEAPPEPEYDPPASSYEAPESSYDESESESVS